jgi:hypothetical protein
MSRTPLAPAALLAAVGCQAQFHSEEGWWAFEDAQLVAQPHTGFGDDESVLAGTAVCPSPHWQGEEIEGWDAEALFAECVAQALGEGARFVEEEGLDCVLLEEPGEREWTLEPADCGAPWVEGEELVSDRVLFQVVGAEGVSAHVDQWPEREAMEGLELEPAGLLDEALLVAEGEAFLLLQDQPVLLFPRLWDEARQEAVAWRAGDGEVLVERAAGTVERLEELEEPGWVGLRLGAGAEAELWLEVRGERWLAGTVRAAAPEDVVSLELLAAYIPYEEGTALRTPWAARAVLLDGQGRPVFGAPVDWSVDGETELVLDPGVEASPRFPGGGYSWVLDACTPPSRQVGDHAATLHASYGALRDSLELSWTIDEANADDDEGWSRDERCAGGCGGCSSRGGGGWGGLLGLLGLLGLGLLHWRRR